MELTIRSALLPLLRRNKVTRHRTISGHISRGALRVRRVLYSQLTLWARTKWARATFFNVEWEMNSLVTKNWKKRDDRYLAIPTETVEKGLVCNRS